MPRIDPGAVAVRPVELHGVGADRLDPVEGQIGGGRVADGAGVGRFAHIGVPPFAHHAGADGAQAVEGEVADVVVVPDDDQFSAVAVGGNFCGGHGELVTR